MTLLLPAGPALGAAVADAFVWAAAPERWRHLVCHIDGQRWFTPLFDGPDASAWLITWAPGTGLPFHDHGTATGALAVVEGELVEHATDRDSIERGVADRQIHRLPAGSVEPLASGLVHAVRNEGAVPAVSIHVYAPRLDDMTFYELESFAPPGAGRLGARR